MAWDIVFLDRLADDFFTDSIRIDVRSVPRVKTSIICGLKQRQWLLSSVICGCGIGNLTNLLFIDNPWGPFGMADTHRSQDWDWDTETALTKIHILSLAVLYRLPQQLRHLWSSWHFCSSLVALGLWVDKKFVVSSSVERCIAINWAQCATAGLFVLYRWLILRDLASAPSGVNSITPSSSSFELWDSILLLPREMASEAWKSSLSPKSGIGRWHRPLRFSDWSSRICLQTVYLLVFIPKPSSSFALLARANTGKFWINSERSRVLGWVPHLHWSMM